MKDFDGEENLQWCSSKIVLTIHDSTKIIDDEYGNNIQDGCLKYVTENFDNYIEDDFCFHPLLS